MITYMCFVLSLIFFFWTMVHFSIVVHTTLVRFFSISYLSNITNTYVYIGFNVHEQLVFFLIQSQRQLPLNIQLCT